jgi:hypothetical protein
MDTEHRRCSSFKAEPKLGGCQLTVGTVQCAACHNPVNRAGNFQACFQIYMATNSLQARFKTNARVIGAPARTSKYSWETVHNLARTHTLSCAHIAALRIGCREPGTRGHEFIRLTGSILKLGHYPEGQRVDGVEHTWDNLGAVALPTLDLGRLRSRGRDLDGHLG